MFVAWRGKGLDWKPHTHKTTSGLFCKAEIQTRCLREVQHSCSDPWLWGSTLGSYHFQPQQRLSCQALSTVSSHGLDNWEGLTAPFIHTHARTNVRTPARTHSLRPWTARTCRNSSWTPTSTHFVLCQDFPKPRRRCNRAPHSWAAVFPPLETCMKSQPIPVFPFRMAKQRQQHEVFGVMQVAPHPRDGEACAAS